MPLQKNYFTLLNAGNVLAGDKEIQGFGAKIQVVGAALCHNPGSILHYKHCLQHLERSSSLQGCQLSHLFVNHWFLKRKYAIWTARHITLKILNFTQYIPSWALYKAHMNLTYSLQAFKYPVFSMCQAHLQWPVPSLPFCFPFGHIPGKGWSKISMKLMFFFHII